MNANQCNECPVKLAVDTFLLWLNQLFAHYCKLRAVIANKLRGLKQAGDGGVRNAVRKSLRCEKTDDLEKPKAELYQTAHNLALNRIRQQSLQRSDHSPGQAQTRVDCDKASPESVVDWQQDLYQLEKAMVRLPHKYRQTYLLSRVENKTYKEIGELLNISESTVEKYIIRSLKYLRGHLQQSAEV